MQYISRVMYLLMMGKTILWTLLADVTDDEEETRETRIKKFKTDDSCWVMVANPAAAGEGIKLHDVCHHAIYIDRTFHATPFMQSMDRIIGMGSMKRNILCKI